MTTNKSFGQWHEVFPNASCVVSLIDHLVHRCEVVAIEGESYRLKEAKERTAQKAAARASAGRKASKKSADAPAHRANPMDARAGVGRVRDPRRVA